MDASTFDRRAAFHRFHRISLHEIFSEHKSSSVNATGLEDLSRLMMEVLSTLRHDPFDFQ
jgi:hypothetical protein